MGKSKKRNKRKRNNKGHLSACIDGYLYATVDGERLIDIASQLSIDPTVLIELNKSLNGLNMRSKFEHNALLVVPSDAAGVKAFLASGAGGEGGNAADGNAAGGPPNDAAGGNAADGNAAGGPPNVRVVLAPAGRRAPGRGVGSKPPEMDEAADQRITKDTLLADKQGKVS